MNIWTLLIIYQLKHFLADYLFQNKYMLGKARAGWDFMAPLLAHVSVHGLFTFFIALYVSGALSTAVGLGLLDLVIHFAMDRVKAGPRYLGRFKDMFKSPFWWSLGFDQMIHHLTHIFIIWSLLQ